MQNAAKLDILKDASPEKAIIGSLLDRLQNTYERLEPYRDQLTPDRFSDDDLGKAYKIMLDMYNEGRRDISNSANEIAERAGIGVTTLLEALKYSLDGKVTEDLPHAAERVIDLYKRRQIRAHAREIAFDAENPKKTSEDTQAKLISGSKVLSDLFDQTDDVVSWGNALSEAFERLKLKNAHTPTGFHYLDAMLHGGYADGSLNLIAARPGCGKTVLGMQIANYCADKAHGVIVVFSLEMERAEIAHRLLCMFAGKYIETEQDMLSMTDEQVRHFNESIERWFKVIDIDGCKEKVPITYICDKDSLNTPGAIRNKLNLLKNRYGSIGLILIDYVQLMEPDEKSRYENRNELLTKVSKALKSIAKEYACPVIALTQLNRNIEHRGGQPMLSDLGDCGALERDADTVLFIHPDMTAGDSEDPGRPVTLYMEKNRKGAKGTVGGEPGFMLYGTISTFREINLVAWQSADNNASSQQPPASQAQKYANSIYNREELERTKREWENDAKRQRLIELYFTDVPEIELNALALKERLSAQRMTAQLKLLGGFIIDKSDKKRGAVVRLAPPEAEKAPEQVTEPAADDLSAEDLLS
mgnify:CR=1 FL=1